MSSLSVKHQRDHKITNPSDGNLPNTLN